MSDKSSSIDARGVRGHGAGQGAREERQAVRGRRAGPVPGSALLQMRFELAAVEQLEIQHVAPVQAHRTLSGARARAVEIVVQAQSVEGVQRFRGGFGNGRPKRAGGFVPLAGSASRAAPACRQRAISASTQAFSAASPAWDMMSSSMVSSSRWLSRWASRKASVSSSAASSWSEAGAADEAGTGVRAASACGENICFTRSMKDAGCDAPGGRRRGPRRGSRRLRHGGADDIGKAPHARVARFEHAADRIQPGLAAGFLVFHPVRHQRGAWLRIAGHQQPVHEGHVIRPFRQAGDRLGAVDVGGGRLLRL